MLEVPREEILEERAPDETEVAEYRLALSSREPEEADKAETAVPVAVAVDVAVARIATLEVGRGRVGGPRVVESGGG